MNTGLVEIKNDEEYIIKTSAALRGEKIDCPDKTTQVEKLDQGRVKIICKKGFCIRV